MTDATGRSFLSYRRARKEDAALLIAAQHERGIPTWQDVSDLAVAPTEDEIRRVLQDSHIANGLLLLTPDVQDSPIIRNVEVPLILERAAVGNGFFVVPLAAGGLSYADAAVAASSGLSAQNLADWNMEKISTDVLTPEDAARVARRVLAHRVAAIHRQLPSESALRLGLFVRKAPPHESGLAIALNWTHRFDGKVASPDSWRDHLLPALSDVADAIRKHAPGRHVDAFGLPTLPAATALGWAFMSTMGQSISWRQQTPGRPDQYWSLAQQREPFGFTPQFMSKNANARDLAVLVSVADNTEPLFASFQRQLPPLRALVHVMKSAAYPHRIESAGQASDIAFTVQEGLREARRKYGNVGTVHLFVAAPAGLVMLIGQLLNTFGAVQTYEHVTNDGSGYYAPAAMLNPSV